MTSMTGGSEKQTAYATSLREQFLAGVEAQIGFARRPGWESGLPRLEQAKAAAEANGDARFWLDRKTAIRFSFDRVVSDLLGNRDRWRTH